MAAKGRKSVTQTNVIGPHGKGVAFEHQESFDDNLLPDADELEKLQQLDPNIMSWIKDTTSKEQAGRLDFNDRKMKVFEGAQKKSFQIDVLTIVIAFLVILVGMGFSYLLIKEGMKIIGTIFGGATVLFAANSFLNFRKRPVNSQSTDSKQA